VDTETEGQYRQTGGSDDSPDTLCCLRKVTILFDSVVTESYGKKELKCACNFKPELMEGLEEGAED